MRRLMLARGGFAIAVSVDSKLGCKSGCESQASAAATVVAALVLRRQARHR